MVYSALKKFAPGRKRETAGIAGFTLLEVMLAVTIMALMSVIIVSGLQMAIKAWETGDREIESQQRIRILLDRLFEELKSAYRMRIKVEEEFRRRYKLGFIGTADRLDFISTADSLTSHFLSTGLKKVSLYVNSLDADLRGLVLEESFIDGTDSFFDPDTEIPSVAYEVAPDVTDIKLRYFVYPPLRIKNIEGYEEGEWMDWWGGGLEEEEEAAEAEEEAPEEEGEQDDWDTFFDRHSNLNLPHGIEITITMIDPRDENNTITYPPVYFSMPDSVAEAMK